MPMKFFGRKLINGVFMIFECHRVELPFNCQEAFKKQVFASQRQNWMQPNKIVILSIFPDLE
jgi:hypothetical protein